MTKLWRALLFSGIPFRIFIPRWAPNLWFRWLEERNWTYIFSMHKSLAGAVMKRWWSWKNGGKFHRISISQQPQPVLPMPWGSITVVSSATTNKFTSLAKRVRCFLLQLQGRFLSKQLARSMANSTADIWCLWKWALKFSMAYFTIHAIRILLPHRHQHRLHIAPPMLRCTTNSINVQAGKEGDEGKIPTTLNPTGVDITFSLPRGIPCSSLSTQIEKENSQKWLAMLGTISVMTKDWFIKIMGWRTKRDTNVKWKSTERDWISKILDETDGEGRKTVYSCRAAKRTPKIGPSDFKYNAFVICNQILVLFSILFIYVAQPFLLQLGHLTAVWPKNYHDCCSNSWSWKGV